MRLNDGDALKATMDECIYSDRDRFSTGYAKAFIEHAPVIDAVPVVRCRDCRFYEEGIRYDGSKCMVCGIYPFPMSHNQDDYCSHGERKGGADDADS